MAKVHFSKLPDDEPTPFDGAGIFSPNGYARFRTTREEALRIATEHCRQLAAGSTVAEVFDGAGIPFRPPYLYGLHERLEDCWVAYLTMPDGWEGLRSNHHRGLQGHRGGCLRWIGARLGVSVS